MGRWLFRRDLPGLVRLNLRYIVFFAAEWLQDIRLRIDTRTGLRGNEGLDGLSMAGERGSARPYAPTPYATLRQLFDALPAELSTYSFVDFGSGKGRTLVVAARRGFKEVIGVEFVEAFHAAAGRNIAAAGVQDLARSILADARDFRIPAGPCILFFFNPFGADVMETVVKNVLASYREHPRPVIVALYNNVTGTFGQGQNFEPMQTLRETWLASLSHTGRYSIQLLKLRPS